MRLVNSVPRRLAGLGAAIVLAASAGIVGGVSAYAVPTTDLIISEYVEGSGSNKAIELYNGSGSAIDLTGYQVNVYFNGSTDPRVFPLEGSAPSGGTFVFASNALAADADQTTGAGLWNGNDAVTLARQGTVVDSIGRIGEDPGRAWASGSVSTVDSTLRRDPGVCAGDPVADDAFAPAAQWKAYPIDSFDGLGAHRTDCSSSTPTAEPTQTPSAEPTPTPTSAPTPTPNATPTSPADQCGAPATPIGDIQGAGGPTPRNNQIVTIEGVVTGDFQSGGFNGYTVQDGGDGDPATSDGIFAYAPNGAAVAPGDVVRLRGRVTEYQGQSQISPDQVTVCASDAELPAPAQLRLPDASDDLERYESMLVTFTQPLVINEYYNYGRFGEIVLGSERQYQPTQLYSPASTQAKELAATNAADRIILDDGRSVQNPDPARHPNGEEFTANNRFRGGDRLRNVTGVVDFRFDTWRIQPTTGADYTATNPRPAPPAVGGKLKVATMNVLNYFTTLDRRGAKNPTELDRQQTKIVKALNDLDADIVGLVEIENNDGVALKTLVNELNQAAGSLRWKGIETGTVGTDEITTAIIYNPKKVIPNGDFAVLDSSVDPRFIDTLNRPVIAQTFRQRATGRQFTVAVNHLKSKGSDCAAVNDPEDPNGQGNCNQTRTKAAQAQADWLASDPTGTGTKNQLLIGDFNSYNKEDPIAALRAAGFIDTVSTLGKEKKSYGYVFGGQAGSLDHILVSREFFQNVTGAADWHSNADEPSILDYTTTYKQPAQQDLYRPDPYRASDHDQVIVGLDLIRKQGHRPPRR